MKTLFLIALVLLPIVLTQDYAVPDLDIDETEANCDNVSDLLATAIADSTRLTNYATITLPARLAKLKNIQGSVKKTCQIVQSRRPSLVQLSTNMMKKRMFEAQNLRNINQDLRVLAAVAVGNKCEKADQSCLMLSEIKSKLYALSTADDPSELCDDVLDSVKALANYLQWLGPAVKSTYVDGKLADRINQLNALSQSCAGCGGLETETDDGGKGGDDGDKDDDGGQGDGGDVSTGCKWYFKSDQHVTFKCLGSIIVPEHTYLDSLTYTGGTQLAPGTDGPYSGTHWRVQTNEEDCSYSFQSLGDYFNPSYQWLDGHTGDGTTGLAPVTTGGYTGTHWQLDQLYDGSYSLKCLGADYNPNYLYLDGRTVDGSVGLAPVTTGGYTGTHWDIELD